APPRRRTAEWRRPRWLTGTLGIVGILVLWQVLAVTAFAARHIVPTPTSVAVEIGQEWSLYVTNLIPTLRQAAIGWLVGNALAVGLAIATIQLPSGERFVLRLAIVTYSMPIIAIGPILVITMTGDGPAAVLAGLSVFFTTLVQTILGLRSADRTSLDLIRAYGGGAWAQLVKIRLHVALPATFAGLSIAGPAAILGAIIGEYLGTSQGLGVTMVNSEQALDVQRTWGIAIVISAAAGAAYLATRGLGRLATPWLPGTVAAGETP
ncbi:MAG: ABC transporter permease, partial [Candidatus Dormibacteraceae bacterium]